MENRNQNNKIRVYVNIEPFNIKFAGLFGKNESLIVFLNFSINILNKLGFKFKPGRIELKKNLAILLPEYKVSDFLKDGDEVIVYSEDFGINKRIIPGDEYKILYKRKINGLYSKYLKKKKKRNNEDNNKDNEYNNNNIQSNHTNKKIHNKNNNNINNHINNQNINKKNKINPNQQNKKKSNKQNQDDNKNSIKKEEKNKNKEKEKKEKEKEKKEKEKMEKEKEKEKKEKESEIQSSIELKASKYLEDSLDENDD